MDHKKLNAWKDSIDLVVKVYEITMTFPKNEEYGITSQMRRSAISVPSNISEGAGRDSKKEYVRFLNISIGSLSELETQMIIAQRLKYINESTIFDEIISVRKLLIGLKNILKVKYKNK